MATFITTIKFTQKGLDGISESTKAVLLSRLRPRKWASK